jgi:hypothetical protein
MAAGVISRSTYRDVTAAVRQAIPKDEWVAGAPPADDPYYIALMLYREFCSPQVGIHAVQATAGLANGTGEQHEQARLTRCVFGNPFRPVTLSPSWITSTVDALARQMYESQDFSPMPILADALQDAGCDSDDVLSHCRGTGPHTLGCWVVDLVLGKG